MTTAPAAFRWRSIVLPALAPTLLFAIGEGAIIPIVASVAEGLGSSIAGAGLVAAMLVVGTLIGDVPSGAIVGRIGERNAMIGAGCLAILGLVTSALAPNPWVLGAGILLVGVATATFALARHAFLTSFVPVAYRARALSTLGGVFRLGYLVGPFATAAIIQLTGVARYAFWIHVVCTIGAILLLVLLRDPAASFGSVGSARAAAGGGPAAGGGSAAAGAATAVVTERPPSVFRTVRERAGVLRTLGLGSMLIAAMRASRQAVLPVWAVSIGMPDQQIAIVLGIAGAIDFSLFFAGGWIMDRFGRLWTAVPSLLGLGAGFFVLAFTHDTADPALWFAILAGWLSIANGIGAGILMTLGADLADPRHPAAFLGAWRLINDTGGAAAPLLVAGLTAAISLPVAVGVIGAVGFLGAGLIRLYLPRYVPSVRARRAAEAAAGAGAGGGGSPPVADPLP